MILNETQSRSEQVLQVAREMMAAARTAPKAKGVDRLEIITLTGDDLGRLAASMRERSEQNGFKFYLRDADNVEQAQAVVLIGTRLGMLGFNCRLCGFSTCDAKASMPSVPCAFNISDMGTAVGSAASVAADSRVDSRVMYSAGDTALSMGLLSDCHMALAILISCTSKNPFFDRVVNK